MYLVLFSLYWAQGLPVGFMTHALPVILRMQGVSLSQIGGFGLLMLPWAIKVLWAPWVDRTGSYRSWIISMQLLTVGMLCAIAFLPLQQHVWLFIALFVMNTFGATQDIATDGLAVRTLSAEHQHWGNTFQVMGSRLGFIVGGGAVLWVMDVLSWTNTFLLLATLVLINTLPILLYQPHEQRINQKKVTLILKMPVCWWLVLISFKWVDGLIGTSQKTMMVDLGLTLTDIGIYISMLGAVTALIGAVIAGLVIKFINRGHALMWFSMIKLISVLGFLYLAWCIEYHKKVSAWVVYAINAFEEFSAAMVLVAMLTLMMGYCRKEYSATDFTFQVSIMSCVSGGLYVLSGIFADWFGYFNYLSLIIIFGVFHLFLIQLWTKNQSFKI
ncbi:MFS transporter [Acinetobacter sp. HY1485]|uniref:MFS transporter n=1 Tax=Acinetobacter sp. HY1485 TaxID=2970918 RepID=UPI0022B9C149|nr:MFS transporter [Acinetobacter sp. HY1485]